MVRFMEGLERGEVVNPISHEEAQADYRLLVQRNGLELLVQPGLDQKRLLAWVREKLIERGVVRRQREVIRVETKIPLQPMEFVLIEPGTFMMGEEGSKVKVTIEKPYEMGMFPVTQWQWAMVMGENPSHLIYKIIPDHTRGAKYRLPTEEEWEYAARAGTDTIYSFGDDESGLSDRAWFGKNAHGTTHAVGLKLPNPWGFYDIHGNVWEWIQDQAGADRVYRGGSWNGYPEFVRSAFGSYGHPSNHGSHVGFRLLRADYP